MIIKLEVILGKTAGFCYGVKRAVTGAEDELKNGEKIYCLGEIVHNNNVIENLRKKGIEFINDIKEAKGRTIIRAHGVTKEVYEIAKEMNVELKDLTCPKVLKIHEIAEEYSKKGYFIALIGNKDHPEIIGIRSFCTENSIIIKDTEEIDKLIEAINKSNVKNILIISQTTFNSKKFDDIVKLIQSNLDNKIYNIDVIKTICPATEMRQKETQDIAKQVDYMIIVGDKKSSNTNKLYEIALAYCEKTVFIENSIELDENEYKDKNKIGIMAGASTPKKDIEDVFEKVVLRL